MQKLNLLFFTGLFLAKQHTGKIPHHSCGLSACQACTKIKTLYYRGECWHMLSGLNQQAEGKR